MQRPDTTTFDRIGGVTTVVTLVERLYARVAQDPGLAPYFHDTSLPSQRDKVVATIGEALGGPRSPWLTGLVEAHRGRRIDHQHFDRMSEHLLEVLAELEVPHDEVELIEQWLATTRPAVVNQLRRS